MASPSGSRKYLNSSGSGWSSSPSSGLSELGTAQTVLEHNAAENMAHPKKHFISLFAVYQILGVTPLPLLVLGHISGICKWLMEETVTRHGKRRHLKFRE